MKCIVTTVRGLLLVIVLLLCGCPGDSSQHQSADRNNSRQSRAASSSIFNTATEENDPANRQDRPSQPESPEDRLARRVDELATQLASADPVAQMKTMQQLIGLCSGAALPLWQRLEQAPAD